MKAPRRRPLVVVTTEPRVKMCTSRACSSSISRRSDNVAADPDRPFNTHPLEVQRGLTIVILGARGVGKTSLVRQFVRSEFSDAYQPTPTRAFYYVSVLINERIYEVKLIDCSAVTRFPSNSLQEWNEYRGYGLRSASAYLLVYDAADDDSFRHVRSMRDQILRHRNAHDVPIYVAANKHDLLVQAAAGAASGDNRGPVGSIAATAKRGGVDLANVVKKQWKCGFVECSTKHNWRVTMVFKELIRAVDHVQYGHRQASTRAIQDALRNNHCAIL